ncbi:unnamed protein product, partial [Porites evermanni]
YSHEVSSWRLPAPKRVSRFQFEGFSRPVPSAAEATEVCAIIEVLTCPVLTNRIEHVTLPTRAQVSTRNPAETQYEVFNCYDRANPPSRDGRPGLEDGSDVTLLH